MAIYRLEFSSDGRYLTMGTRQQVGLRDLATGRTWWRREVATPTYPINARPANGGVIFLSGAEGAVKWWDPRTDQVISLGVKAFFKGINLSREGRRAVWIDRGGTIFMADLPEGRVDTMVGHQTALRSLAVSPDGRWLATTHGTAVRVFALPEGDVKRFDLGGRPPGFEMHDVALVRAAGPTGRIVATSREKALDTIDSHTGERQRLAELDQPIQALAISPDGRRAAAAGAGGLVVAVDLHGGAQRELARLPAACDRLGFVGDHRLAGVDEKGVLHLWDLSAGSHETIGRTAPASSTHVGALLSARGRPRLMVSAGREILIIDLQPARTVRLDSPGIMFNSTMSEDGRKVAAGLGDGRVVLWEEVGSEMRLRPLARRAGFVQNLSFTGNALIVADETGVFTRFDLATGAATEIGRHTARIMDASPSLSGRWLATSDTTGEIRLWEPATGGLSVLRGRGEPRSVEFAGEDRLISTGADGQLEIFTVDGGAFVPHAPAALARWLGALTTARIDARGDPVSSVITER
jgi:WD40 repeat protein